MTLRTTSADVVIVGAGVAGLSAALALRGRRVHLVSKGPFGNTGASPMAQGGMAAAVGAGDSPSLHASDTFAVSGGTADRAVVSIVTGDAPSVVEQLVGLGASFDRDAAGELSLGREAGHARSRIVHARDATGAEIVRALSHAVSLLPTVEQYEGHRAIELAQVRGRVVGLWTLGPDGHLLLHLAPAVVLATGGLGRLYSHTTNPVEATADGLALAARAGARLADLEMVQFHPTALAAGTDPMPLLTEALRGAGAVIRDDAGRRFLLDVDARGELAPRDVVALALYRHVVAGGHAWLDARAIQGRDLAAEFPTAFDACLRHGFDLREQPVPIAPAAHYHMGGIAADHRGRTTVNGLWACGEAACTGLHGANRLASNSLLEGIVFGARVGADVGLAPRTVSAAPLVAPVIAEDDEVLDRAVASVRALMWEHCGIVRHASGLDRALRELVQLGRVVGHAHSTARNVVDVATLVAWAALERRESRGSHSRTDYPQQDPAWARRHFVEPGVTVPPGLAAGARR